MSDYIPKIIPLRFKIYKQYLKMASKYVYIYTVRRNLETVAQFYVKHIQLI